MSSAPESTQNTYAIITEVYIEQINRLLQEKQNWWNIVMKLLGTDYERNVQLSLTNAQSFVSLLNNSGYENEITEGKNQFLLSLNLVIDTTTQADRIIKSAKQFGIALEYNDTLKEVAQNTWNKLTKLSASSINNNRSGGDDNDNAPIQDRAIFSVSVKQLLENIARAGEIDLVVILTDLQSTHNDYGTVQIKERPYDTLTHYLTISRADIDLRKYSDAEWAAKVTSIVNAPEREPVIDGRMFINAAILAEFKIMYELASEKKKLHKLCRALYEQLTKEINGDFAAQLTEQGKELYAFLLNPAAASTEPLIKSRLHSDTTEFGESDVLNYDLIAQNLFSILKDKSTKPPLNIGILAPWGRGKTNLMKRIKAKFDDEAKSLRTEKPETKQAPKLSLLRQWLKEDGIGVKHNLPFATVWFNPWNYQSSDMIWAGLANNVIEQVVEQIPSQVEREIFWMQLRLARIDKDELRKDLQTRFVLFVGKFIMSALTLIIATILFLTGEKTTALSVLGFGGVPSIMAFLAGAVKPYNVNISEAFSKYTKAPKYNEKLGTFHEVEADMNRVLDLCVDAEKPLVVFVDDLDRCSPSKIVEVIEAINVFISGKYNNKCYFILGMDAEVVAGALDVTYEKMKGKLTTKESEQGSIGWYFLDKFIQLPFFIPVMSETKKKEYLASLLAEKISAPQTDTTQPKTIDKDKVQAVFNNVMAANNVAKSKTAITEAALSPEETAHLDKLILQNQVQSEKQNEEIKQQIALYGQFVSSDPRSLKRFANLLRFHCGYQFLRMKKGQSYVEPKVLAKWLVLMLKFPQLVRWIQWDLENKSGLNSNAEEKAILFDKLIEDFISKADSNNKDNEFGRWGQFVFPKELNQGKQPIKIEELNEMLWFKSPNMFKILMNNYSQDDKFKNALDCNVW